MKRRLVLAVAALFVGVLSIAAPFLTRPAAAADPPVLVPIGTLIPILDALKPALEIVSPIVWPQCADATLVTVLGGALGVPVPPVLSAVTGPLLVICGAVPQPKTQGRVCQLDTSLTDPISALTTKLAGTSLPVEVAPEKWLTGLLDNIVDRVPLKAVPIGSTVVGVLHCVDPKVAQTPTTLAPASAPTSVAGSSENADLNLPTFESLQTLPALDSSADGLSAAPSLTPIAAAPQVRFINQPKFRYPVVMGLPLLFIGLLVFFGRALTRPLLLKEDQL